MAHLASLQVLEWNEAMQQCGDDEEFLRELLQDLKGEAGTQIQVIRDTTQNAPNNAFELIMRSAHMLKGASANLMCHQMREAAFRLEESARAAHQGGGKASAPQLQQAVQQAIQDLELAVNNYNSHLASIGL